MQNEYVIDSDENSDYMYNTIAKIIENCGPRAPCSEAEKKASQLISEELNEYCDSVSLEEFKAYPRAFLGWIRLEVGIIMLSFLIFGFFFWLYVLLSNDVVLLIGGIISLGFAVFGLIVFYKQFWCYEEWIPKFLPYKQGTSQNVVGIIRPKKEVTKRVIFGAHYDSAFRFNLIHYTKQGYAYYFASGVIILISFVILYLVQVIFIFLPNHVFNFIISILIWLIILIPPFLAIFFLLICKSEKVLYGGLKNMSINGYVSILGTTIYSIIIDIILWQFIVKDTNLFKISTWLIIKNPITIIALIFFISKKATPGATDNLTGVAVIMCVAKILNDWRSKYSDLFPQNTEIIISILGSEEIGLRGAKAFALKHAKEYNKIDTTVVNCDTLTESRYQKIFTRENTTRTDLSPEIYNLLIKCCEELNIKYVLKEMPGISGGTDAAGFIKGGLKASSLEGIVWGDYLSYYHTDRDNLDIINKKRKPCEDMGTKWNERNVRGAMENAVKIMLKYLELKDKEKIA